MTDFRIGIDAATIERTVRDSLRGLDRTLEGLRDLHGFDCGESDVEIDETIEVGAGAELVITTMGGDVRVRGADGNRIRVKAEGESRLPETPRVEREGNRVIFNAPAGSEIDVEATVPRDCSVTVNTHEGDVDIDNAGAVEVKTINGDVTALGISGSCTVTTGQADATIERLSGALTFHTVNGDLDVSDSYLRSADLHSVDGDLTVDASLGHGPFRLQTVNGDVELALPARDGAEIHFHTANGDISCDLPAQVSTASSREWHAQINGGGPRVDIETVNGDLEIEEGHSMPAGDAARPAAPPPPPPAYTEPVAPEDTPSTFQSEDTTDVLRALERGEISVDEAMERLSSGE
jgi:DUF4097 and DUF4098 domain-containing protein YvlB